MTISATDFLLFVAPLLLLLLGLALVGVFHLTTLFKKVGDDKKRAPLEARVSATAVTLLGQRYPAG